MYKEIFLDHAYTEDMNFKFMKQLQSCGFILAEKEVEHPGKSFCRFIYLNEKQYLEFVHVGRGGIKHKVPGISFGAKNLESYAKKIELKAKFKVASEHKNYNWKENSVDRLPGWNFVVFFKLKIQTYYPWFTEYEHSPTRQPRVVPIHPNGVCDQIGIEISVNKTGTHFYETLLGEKLKDQVTLPDKRIIFFRRNARANRFHTVVLKSGDFEKTKSFFKKHKIINYYGYEAIRIKNPHPNARMWDIVIVR